MHTHRTQTDVLRRVRALLAQAEDPACTPEEAAAFSAKAEALVAKHAVDEALLEAREHRGRPTTRRVEFPAPYAKPKGQLLAGIAGAYGCRVISRAGEGYTLIGYRSDIDAVEMLFTSLLVQGAHGCTRGDRSFRSAYWYGFAGRVAQRVREQRERTVAEAEPGGRASGPGAAVVLADRSDEVDRYTREQFPRTRQGSPGRVGSRDGLLAGDASGRRADLGEGRLGAPTPRGRLDG